MDEMERSSGLAVLFYVASYYLIVIVESRNYCRSYKPCWMSIYILYNLLDLCLQSNGRNSDEGWLSTCVCSVLYIHYVCILLL